MTRAHTPLRPGSYLAFLVWALVLVAAVPDAGLGPLLALVVAFGWLNNRGALRVLASPRLWLFIFSTVALTPLLLGEPDVRWGLLGISWTGLETGFWMALRAITLTLASRVSSPPTR